LLEGSGILRVLRQRIILEFINIYCCF